jgi:hypothetical protein
MHLHWHLEKALLTLIPCPECGFPAEVTDRFLLAGTSGPVDHVVLQCAAGHFFRMPSELLCAQGQEQLQAQEREMPEIERAALISPSGNGAALPPGGKPTRRL